MMTRSDVAAMCGTTHATRHADVVLIHWASPSEWRFAVTNNASGTGPGPYLTLTGPHYATRVEALSDPTSVLARYDRAEA